MSNDKINGYKLADYFLWFIAFAIMSSCFVLSRVYFSSTPLYAQIVIWLIFIGLALLPVVKTRQGERLVAFIVSAKQEIKKVVWPTRKETGQVTLIVTVIVIIVAFFLWLLDSLLAVIARWFLGG